MIGPVQSHCHEGSPVDERRNGKARPLRSGIIRYVREGRQTDRQVDGLTDGQMNAYCPLPYGRRPCSDFTDMLWRLTNRRIIIIIIMILYK